MLAPGGEGEEEVEKPRDAEEMMAYIDELAAKGSKENKNFM